uniref:Uncharacterized protein MANES_02G031800 n=1 Tax=Rhizophora mucronata TaxID=61149 RepID=A0A2P2LE27_RHIMU
MLQCALLHFEYASVWKKAPRTSESFEVWMALFLIRLSYFFQCEKNEENMHVVISFFLRIGNIKNAFL